MKKEDILKAIEELKKTQKRNFSQSYDLVINLKSFDLKKEGNKVDNFIVLPYDKGKKVRICAFVDKELVNTSKETFDHVVLSDDFGKLDKIAIKKLAKSYDFFVAQGTIMTNVAKYFGKILGPRNLMPNPKGGGVITAGMDLKALNKRLQKTIRATARTEPTVKVSIGKEGMKDDEIAENVLTVYNSVLHSLPQEKQNIKNVILKLTMSKGVKIGS
nr:hypothetical protein [Candidatus Woesearchaeota archaeon]